MSSEDPVPWEDLSANRRRQFYHMLQESGLDLDDVEDAEPFYGNRHRAEAEIMRRSQMPGHEPEHDDHYGTIHSNPEVELYGVGEFHPDVAGAGTPVFEAKTENGSYITFAFLPEDVSDEYMRVFHANSYEEGEFSLLMNRVLQHFQGADPEPKTVAFTNVVTSFLDGADLDDKVHGFETEVVEIPSGERLRELVGEWDPTGEA